MGLSRRNPTYVLFTRRPRSISLAWQPHEWCLSWGVWRSGYKSYIMHLTPWSARLIWREPKSLWASHLRQCKMGWAVATEDEWEYFDEYFVNIFMNICLLIFFYILNILWKFWWICCEYFDESECFWWSWRIWRMRHYKLPKGQVHNINMTQAN